MGNSIFEFEELFNINSPFQKNELPLNTETQAGNFNTTSTIIPSITLNNKDKIYPIKTASLFSFLLKGEIGKVYDTRYNVKIKSSGKLKISTTEWTGSNDYNLDTMISSNIPQKVTLYIEIEGINRGTFFIEFRESKDVFKEYDVDKLRSEFSYMSAFVKDHSPSEYANNYCMQGADRAMGKLLNNSSNFYTVEHKTHKVINSINFSNQTTYTRAKQLADQGYLTDSYTIDTKYWNVDKKIVNKIYNSLNKDEARNYGAKNQYEVVSVSKVQGEAFLNYLKNIIDKKEPGYHIYYLSVVDGYHTQILIINNLDRKNPKYEIWEDKGMSSSSGKLNNIIDGINRQTSSMFTSSCINRFYKNKTDSWDRQTLKIWKITAK